MINKTTFARRVAKFSSANIRTELVEMLVFMALNFHQHGNSDPIKRVEKAEMTQWVKKILLGFKMGKRDESMTEEQITPKIFEHVVIGLADHNDELVAAKAAREARRAASVKSNPETGEACKSVATSKGAQKPSAGKKADTKAGPVTKPEHSYYLTIGDEDHQLTQTEAKALLVHLQAMRKTKPMRKTG